MIYGISKVDWQSRARKEKSTRECTGLGKMGWSRRMGCTPHEQGGPNWQHGGKNSMGYWGATRCFLASKTRAKASPRPKTLITALSCPDETLKSLCLFFFNRKFPREDRKRTMNLVPFTIGTESTELRSIKLNIMMKFVSLISVQKPFAK